MFVSGDSHSFLGQSGVWCNNHICLEQEMKNDNGYSSGSDIPTEVEYSIVVMSS